jgi:hypothetical protein
VASAMQRDARDLPDFPDISYKHRVEGPAEESITSGNNLSLRKKLLHVKPSLDERGHQRPRRYTNMTILNHKYDFDCKMI